MGNPDDKREMRGVDSSPERIEKNSHRYQRDAYYNSQVSQIFQGQPRMSKLLQ
jgi:hypothetical protein